MFDAIGRIQNKNNNEQKRKINYKSIITIVAISVTTWMVITFVHATVYSVFVADDFGHASQVELNNASLHSIFCTAIKYAADKYLTWQGTYLAMFLQIFLDSVNKGGLDRLGHVMAFNSASFLCVIILMIFALFRMIEDENKHYMLSIIIMCVIYLIVGHTAYIEVFFWYSGAVSYSMPLTLLCLGLFFLIREENFKNTIATVTIGILAMGGTLAVAAMGCYIVFLICVYDIVNKKFSKKHIIALAIWGMFAAVNAMAPGNFVRHSFVDSSGTHPIQSIGYSVKMVGTRLGDIFGNTDYLFVLSVILICSVASCGNKWMEESRNHLATGVMSLFLPIVTSYPMALGYSGMFMENRGLFMIDMSVIAVSIYLAAILAGLIRKIAIKKMGIAIGVIGSVAIVISVFDGYRIIDSNIKLISDMLTMGVYQEHYKITQEFYDSLEKYEKGTDVRIPRSEIPFLIKNSSNFYIFEDPNHTMNTSVASWYGFNSIAIYDD